MGNVERGIKGVLFSAVVADLLRSIDAGHIDREAVEARLRPGDLKLLDSKIDASVWYDIHTYHRLVEVLKEVEGGGSDDYWFKRGQRAGGRMIEMGIYQQLDYLGRSDGFSEKRPEARMSAFRRDMKLVMTLHAAMLNFGEWTCDLDPEHDDRYCVNIRGVAGVPDGVFRAAAGLFNRLAEMTKASSTRRWRFERPKADRVCLRMNGPV